MPALHSAKSDSNTSQEIDVLRSSSLVVHYLLSVPVSEGYYAFAYLVTADPDAVDDAINHLIDNLRFMPASPQYLLRARHRAGPLAMPICQEVILDASGVEQVQNFLSAMYPRARELLKSV